MVFIGREDLEVKEKRFDGFYVAKVVSNSDPLKIARVRIRVPGIHDGISDDNLPWAAQLRPNFLGGSSQFGSFSVPKVGSEVVVVFDKGDPNSPIYIGELVTSTSSLSLAKNSYPSRFGWSDGCGELDYVDQEDNKRVIKVAKLLDVESGKDIEEKAEEKILIRGKKKVKIESLEEIEIIADEIKIIGSSIKFKKK